MAIKQSPWASGTLMVARPQTAHAVHEAHFVFDVKEAVAAADIIEIGALPAYARVIDAAIFAEGAFGAATAKAGFLTGTFGDADSVNRVLGSEFFTAAALDGSLSRLNKADAFNTGGDDTDHAIGVQLSAAATAAAGKRIHLVLLFAQ